MTAPRIAINTAGILVALLGATAGIRGLFCFLWMFGLPGGFL